MQNTIFLKQSFVVDAYPTFQKKFLIAKHLNLTYDQVSIWYNNERKKWKKSQTEYIQNSIN